MSGLSFLRHFILGLSILAALTSTAFSGSNQLVTSDCSGPFQRADYQAKRQIALRTYEQASSTYRVSRLLMTLFFAVNIAKKDLHLEHFDRLTDTEKSDLARNANALHERHHVPIRFKESPFKEPDYDYRIGSLDMIFGIAARRSLSVIAMTSQSYQTNQPVDLSNHPIHIDERDLEDYPLPHRIFMNSFRRKWNEVVTPNNSNFIEFWSLVQHAFTEIKPLLRQDPQSQRQMDILDEFRKAFYLLTDHPLHRANIERLTDQDFAQQHNQHFKVIESF